jgi:hypothetical protein
MSLYETGYKLSVIVSLIYNNLASCLLYCENSGHHKMLNGVKLTCVSEYRTVAKMT